MGADSEQKQELFPDAIGRADRLACDGKIQCLRLGEFHHALRAGVINQYSDIIELSDLTGGRRTGRKNDEEITVCDLTGVGVQETTTAVLTLPRRLSRSSGSA